jgi:hypothetical protein
MEKDRTNDGREAKQTAPDEECPQKGKILSGRHHDSREQEKTTQRGLGCAADHSRRGLVCYEEKRHRDHGLEKNIKNEPENIEPAWQRGIRQEGRQPRKKHETSRAQAATTRC